MPPRRAHRKSRTGCVPCKKRHVKCDEKRPNCLNCLEYEVDCNYLPTTAVSLRDTLRGRSTPEPSNSTNDPARSTIPAAIGINSIPENEDLDVSDLELMHFFSTETYATMSSVRVEQELWRTTIITIGLQHKFLLRGLLAHAAAHLSFLNPSPKSLGYLIKASTHQDIAIAQFRKALDTINDSTFDAVLAFSCLLPIHSVGLAACAATRPQLAGHEQDSLSETLKAIRLFRSVNRLLLPSLSVFTTSTILPLLQIVTQALPEADTYPGSSSIDLLERACIQSNPYYTLALSNRNKILSDTIRELRLTFAREAYRYDTEKFTIGIILIWAISIPDEYMALCDERDAAAMAVLAHYAALLSGYDATWWLSGLGGTLVGSIGQYLNDDTEWEEVMEWPRAVVERVRRERGTAA